MKKILLAVAIVAVLAMAFTSVGYAYTASTENSGNSVISQYVTLTQQNYTFAGGSVSFDVIETEAGIKYQLVGTAVPLTSIEGADYMGVSIGTDKLSASATGWTGGLLDVAVTSPQLDGTWFTDYSGDLHGWRYVLKVTADCDIEDSVSDINGLTPSVGDCYRIEEHGGGTLTRGNLTVDEGDVVGFDGSVWVLMPDQYAHYSGSSNGMWVVKGQHIASQYRVAAADADAGGYIKLYSSDNIKNVTVVVIKHVDGHPTIHHVYLNEGITEPIDLGKGTWYVDGRLIPDGKYTVGEADTDGGVNVVIYDAPCDDVDDIADYTVVKIDNGTADVVYGQTAGQAVYGVSGWNVGGGIKFRILTGATYTTELFFAGEAADVNSSLRSSGSIIKTTASITVTPEWEPAGDADVLKYTLKSGLGTGADRVVYVESGSKVMLPENCFEAPTGKVFVGWKADNLDKVFTKGHMYNSFTEERTFTAQWADPSDCWTISFDPGTGGLGQIAGTYLLKNEDSGSTFTLPPCSFTNPGHEYTGWKVTGKTSSKVYSESAFRFTDINGVKEGLTLTAQWAEAKNGANVVSITFDTYTAVVIPHEGSATATSGLEIGDTITLAAGTWYVKGVEVVDAEGTAGVQYVLRASDVVQGGYVILYQDKPSENEDEDYKYRAIKVEGNSVWVSDALAAGANVDGVGGWKVNGAGIYGGLYKVKAADADDAASRFIVAYEFTNDPDEYTVIMVPESGTPTMTRGLHKGETIPYTGETWYVKGVAKADSYTVGPDDAVNGFIVLSKVQNYNAPNKYAVIKAGNAGATVTKDRSEGDKVADLKGWKVRGTTVGIYKVLAADAAALGSDGFILIYSNMAATYVVYTGENGYYSVPYSISPPPDDPVVIGFKGWKLVGWNVTANSGRNAPQSYTMPSGTDGYIVKGGTIKFAYSNDLHNGEELA